MVIAFPLTPAAYPKTGSITGGALSSGVETIVPSKLAIGLITFVSSRHWTFE
jgi:hypothetical protein